MLILEKLGMITVLLWLVGDPLQTQALDARLSGVNDWVYVLQFSDTVTPSAMAATSFDLVVMDYSADGSQDTEFLPSDIAAIKASGKVVLAYMSIGEAEIQRFYWDSSWNDQPSPDPDAPAWLGPFNPQFPDNYKVRYWDPQWQAIIFGTASGVNKSYLDRIIDQGFDGVYLDIIDGFEFWSSEMAELTRLQARADMIHFVVAIRDYARVTRGVSNFLIFPQNGPAIIHDDSNQLDALGTYYLGRISGIGAEDTFYNALDAQTSATVTEVTQLLDTYRSGSGDTRLVLAVDYVWDLSDPIGAANAARYNDFEVRSLAHSYVPYAAVSDRDLNEILTISGGGTFAQPQPKPNGATTGAIWVVR